MRRNVSESSEIQSFFPPKIRWSPKKKKKKKRSSPKFRVIFRPKSEIQRFFLPKIRWSPRKKKKKRSSPKFRVIFWPKSEIQRFFPPKIRSSPNKKKKKKRSLLKVRPVFHPNSLKFPAKSLKAWCPTYKGGGHASILLTLLCNFAILATQRGGHGSMAPPKYAPVQNIKEPSKMRNQKNPLYVNI